MTLVDNIQAGFVQVAAAIKARTAALDTRVKTTEAAIYDSGERDLKGHLEPGHTADLYTIQRVGRVVTVTFENLVSASGGTAVVVGVSNFPAGFRPTGERNYIAATGSGVGARGRVRALTIALNQATAGAGYSGTVTYLVPAALPTSLPGVPL